MLGGGIRDVFGGNTPLTLKGEKCWALRGVETTSVFLLAALMIMEDPSSCSGLGTDLALTSSKFSTTYPISGPARYLMFQVHFCYFRIC